MVHIRRRLRYRIFGIMTDKQKDKPVKAKNAALKDHVLFAPPLVPKKIEIKKGDDLDKLDIPEKFKQSLVTEGVMKGK